MSKSADSSMALAKLTQKRHRAASRNKSSKHSAKSNESMGDQSIKKRRHGNGDDTDGFSVVQSGGHGVNGFEIRG